MKQHYIIPQAEVALLAGEGFKCVLWRQDGKRTRSPQYLRSGYYDDSPVTIRFFDFNTGVEMFPAWPE